MRKAIIQSVATASLFAASAEALKHPFMGEHAGKNAVHHENGLSMRLGAKPGSNKHRSFVPSEGIFEEGHGFFRSLYEEVNSRDKAKTDFEKQIQQRNAAKRAGHKKKLGQINVSTVLENEDGFMYTAELYMGRLFKMDVVYDTGSDWLVVEGKDCDTCDGNTYDIQPSLDNGQGKVVGDTATTRKYGSATFEGREYSDLVCVLFSACVEDFEFFLIEKQEGLEEPIDGIMGMARNNPFHIEPEKGNTAGPLYINALAEQNIIPSNKFSFYFTEPGDLSFVDLGDPSLDNVRADATLETLNVLEEDFFWANYCQGIAIGDITPENSYAWSTLEEYDTEVNNTFYTIFDTGSTALMISTLYYESVIAKIMEKVDVIWSIDSGLIYTECEADYPNLYFMFEQKWIEVAAKDYVFPVSNDGLQCILFIMPADLPMNILGVPAFVDYYTVHDPEAGTISFAPHTASTKDSLVRDQVPTQILSLGGGSGLSYLAFGNIDGSALLLSWTATAIIVFLFLDWWGYYARPQWEYYYSDQTYILATAVFFFGTIMVSIYWLQPLLFSEILNYLEGTASVSLRTLPKKFDTFHQLDNALLGAILGYLCYFVLRQLYSCAKPVAAAPQKAASQVEEERQMLAGLAQSDGPATNAME